MCIHSVVVAKTIRCTFKKGHQAGSNRTLCSNMTKVCRKNEEISVREFAYQWPLKTWEDDEEEEEEEEGLLVSSFLLNSFYL